MKTKINLLNHELIPKHIILLEKEKEEVMKVYRIKTLNQFPKISKSDPIVRMIEAKPDDLIKIIRKSNTAKESIYYRVVTEV